METPTLTSQDTIKNDLEKEEKLWSIFEEFHNEFQKLCSEEWIVFRKRCYKFEDFLNNWRERLERTENSALVTRILQELHKYEVTISSKDFYPNLTNILILRTLYLS